MSRLFPLIGNDARQFPSFPPQPQRAGAQRVAACSLFVPCIYRVCQVAFKPASLVRLPSSGAISLAREGLGALRPLDQSAPFDPLRDGPAIVAAQQSMPGSAVGGFCQVTTILRDGIATRVLHRSG